VQLEGVRQNFTGAEEMYKRVLACDPHHPTTLSNYGGLLHTGMQCQCGGVVCVCVGACVWCVCVCVCGVFMCVGLCFWVRANPLFLSLSLSRSPARASKQARARALSLSECA
jgi:hypothetical protein